jgi:predicted regulator of Ras-like GTPase activity (Roadblock/LC7/MglB family)
MQSIPVLTVQTSNHLAEVLEEFLDKSEASFAMVIERGGSVLSQSGTIPEAADADIVAALGAGSFAATKELALRIGEPEFSSLHQQGENHQIFMAGVNDDTILVIIFGHQTTLGLVRFYAGRTLKQISGVLEENRANQNFQPVFSPHDVASAEKVFGE